MRIAVSDDAPYPEGADGKHAWTAVKPDPPEWRQHYDFLMVATRSRSRDWECWRQFAPPKERKGR